ncbi:MAG: phage tail tape measure protein, partial [bacterium]
MPKDATVRLIFGADTAEAEAALGRLKSQIGNFGSALTSAGTTLSAAFTAPVAGLIKLASNFDEAMDKIRARTGATGQALADLGEVFRKVYASVPTSIDAASTAISDLATKADLSGKSLEDVAKAVLELSRLTGADLNATIDASSKLFMNWGIQAENMVSTLDFLFKVSQSTGVSIDQLNANLASYGSMLREYGFSIEEAATMIGAFSKQGVELDKVMTGLRIALTEFAKAGISDAAGALRAVIEEIKNAGSAAEANSIAIQVFGSRAGPYLAQQIREGRLEWQSLLKSLQSSGETIEKAGQDTMSFAEKLSLLKQHAAEALEPLGAQLLNIVERQLPSLEGAIKSVIDLWNNLGESGQSALVQTAIYLAIGGPILIGLGAVINSLKSILGLLALIASHPIVAILTGVAAAIGAVAVSIANVRSQIDALEAKYGSKYVAALQSGVYGTSLAAQPWLAPSDYSDVGTKFKQTTDTMADSAIRAYDTFKKVSFGIGEIGNNAQQAGSNLGDFSGSLEGAGDAAQQAVEELTPLDKLLQAIANDAAQFKPWTSTEYNLYELKSMSESYSTISEQLKTQAYWENKATEAAQKRKEALEE